VYGSFDVSCTGLVKDGNLVTSVSSSGFAQSTSTASWQSVDFTYTSTGNDVINGATVYKTCRFLRPLQLLFCGSLCLLWWCRRFFDCDSGCESRWSTTMTSLTKHHGSYFKGVALVTVMGFILILSLLMLPLAVAYFSLLLQQR